MNPNRNPSLLAAALAALLCAATVSPQEATITVTNTADTGAGTLRNALASANNGVSARLNLCQVRWR